MEKNRIEWLDSLKGFCIIMVVVGHIIRGFISAGMFDKLPLKYIDYTIYSFHMPLMFFLSGILYSKVNFEQFKDWKKFIVNKIIKLYIPYLVFAYVMVVFKLLFAKSINSVVNFKDLIMIPLNSFDIYWFLIALLTIFIIYSLLDYKNINKKIIMSISLFSLIVSFYLKEQLNYNYYISMIFYYIGLGFYFYLGKILSKINFSKMFIIPLLFFYIIVNLGCYFLELKSGVLIIMLAVSMILTLTIIFQNYSVKMKSRKMLIFIGKSSMVIYLIHTFFTAATRIFLNKLDINSFTIQFFIALIAGITIPILIYYIINKFKFLSFLDFLFYPKIKNIKTSKNKIE